METYYTVSIEQCTNWWSRTQLNCICVRNE